MFAAELLENGNPCVDIVGTGDTREEAMRGLRHNMRLDGFTAQQVEAIERGTSTVFTIRVTDFS